ncbi:MAG: DUF5005 domain-containing protein [Desulfobacterales bacterium]|nr:DUF5005 domain-containing protein [Desulfobacterales bacterium]
MTSRNYLFIIFLSVSLSFCAGGKPGPHVTVEALPQYDALFSNEEGWTGGDGVYSVALNDHTIAWFFGDTWIGQIKNGRHVNATLVNNSVAIQHDRRPAEAEMDFYFGRAADGSPAALMRPADGRGWFWVFDGVMTAKGLYLFLIQIERTAGNAVFDFKVIGAWLGQVENPNDPPSQWRVRQFKIPWVEFSASRGMLWGSTVIQVKNFLYIYGTTEDRQNTVPQKHMILARVPISMLDDFSRWRFYADGNWVSDFTRASRLCEKVPHEYSVSYLPALKQFALVYSQDGLSKNILARLSPDPQGPWSAPIQLYQCPEADWDDSIFCYAAKAHTILSEIPDMLVITYIANSVDFDKTVNDARLYRPRFLRATFKSIK